MARARTSLIWVLGGIGSVLLLAAFAGVRPADPWGARHTLELDPHLFQSPTSRISPEPGGIRIEGVAADGSVAISQPLQAPLAAADYRFLRARLVHAVPGTRWFLWFKQAGEAQLLPLSCGNRGECVADLSTQPAWQGEIEAVGLAWVPLAYQSAEFWPDAALELAHFRLESNNAGAALATMMENWFEYRPWNGRSNHTGGFEFGADPGPSMAGWVAAASLWWLVLSLLAPPADRARWGGGILLSALAAMGLAQVWQVAQRAEVAVTASSAVPDDAAWALSAMPGLSREVAALAEQWRARPPGRILVWGDSGFLREYPSWLLREFNVGSLVAPSQIHLRLRDESDVILLLGGSSGWSYDSNTGRLHIGDAVVAASPEYRGTQVQAFKLATEQQP